MEWYDVFVGLVMLFIVLPGSAVVIHGLLFDDDGKAVRP